MNKSKKWLAVFLMAALLLSGCGKKEKQTAPDETTAASSTAEEAKDTCAHEPDGEGEVHAAACTADGYTVYTCKLCGELYEDGGIAPLGHSYAGTVTGEAACTADGIMTYTCSRCGDHYTQTITKTGHNYSYQSDASSHWQECASCGSKLSAEKHTFNDKNVCTVCGYGCTHRYTTWSTAATCTEYGYTAHTCSLCGYVYYDSWKAPTGHSYKTATTAATCTEDGKTTYTCTKCGDFFSESIPHTGHHKVILEGKEPACEQAGLTEGIYCTACRKYITAQTAIDAPGHSYGYTSDATGHWQVCSVCGDTTASTAHSFEDTVVEPGCIAPGYTTHVCSVCGYRFTDSETPALGHTYEGGICTKCGEAASLELPIIHIG